MGVSIAVISSTFIMVRNKFYTSPERMIFPISVIYCLLFFSLAGNFNWLMGGLLMILISVCSSLTDQLFSQYINIHTESQHRATTLSAISLFIKFPYVALAILLGVLADKQLLPQFCMVAGVFAFGIWIFSFLKYRRVNNKAKTVVLR
jgi:hypothetical protein